MKTSIAVTILLALAAPAFAAEDYQTSPTQPDLAPFAWQPREPRDWRIFYNVRIAVKETVPLSYWQDFDTAAQCLAKLQELRERVDKTPAAYSGYSDMRCGKAETYVAPERKKSD